MIPNKHDSWGVNVAPWAGAALIAVLAILRLQAYYPSDLDASGNSDAFHTYLPAARKLLDNGWDFLLNDPFSTRVAPLGYLWPALWQADVAAIRWANSALFVLSALMIAVAAKRLGGWGGAAVAVALLIYHPGIAFYMPKVLTEPLYLFGLVLLSWSLVEILLYPGARRTRWFLLGGFGLTITLLTRPVLQFMTLGAIALVAALLFMPSPPIWRRCLRNLLVMLLVSCVLPLTVIIKNGTQFGLWGMGTGSGAGLYYGINPLRLGHEPAFMGFSYDIGEVVRAADPTTGGEPLDRTADRIERSVALSLLQNTQPWDLVRFFGFKLRSWLLYSTPEIGFDPNLRKFRLFEWLCIAAAAGVWWIRRWRPGFLRPTLPRPQGIKLVVALLSIGVATMLAQMTPLLYNTRYNAGFFEPWLLLLTAAAVGSLLPAWQSGTGWHWRSPRWSQAAILLLLVAIAALLTNRSKRHETLPLDPERLGPAASVLSPDHFGPAVADALAIGQQHWQLTNLSATLEIPSREKEVGNFPAMDFMDGVWRFKLRIMTIDAARCRTAKIRVEHPAGELGWPRPVFPIVADGQWHTYAVHANHNLRPTRPGRLWLSINCQPGAQIMWGGAELLRSTMPEAARAFWLEGTPLNPYTPTAWDYSSH